MVRFYLAETWIPQQPPPSDYPLSPEIGLPALEGEWTSPLTIPTDVPSGKYHLVLQVDATNDVIECNSRNNPAAYLPYQIRIGTVDEGAQAVDPKGKQPIVLGKLKTTLFQNYPNPFNPETWIPYQLAISSPVEIAIYNSKGLLVRQINEGVKPAGQYLDRHRATYWDGRNDHGERASSGVYWYQLHTPHGYLTRKMILKK